MANAAAATIYWNVANPSFGVVDDVLYLFTTNFYLAYCIFGAVSASLLFRGVDYGCAIIMALFECMVAVFLLSSAAWTLSAVDGGTKGWLVYVVATYAMNVIVSGWYLKFSWAHSTHVEKYRTAYQTKMHRAQQKYASAGKRGSASSTSNDDDDGGDDGGRGY